MNGDSPIPEATTTVRRRALLEEPTYGWGEKSPRRPTIREIVIEWFDAVNFVKNPRRRITALQVAFHAATFVVFVCWMMLHFSLVNLAIVIGIAAVLGTVYNTVWYHRYCTHRAFQFRSRAWTRLFLWTNPICFREENYVIPHHVHHAKADRPGDPYGPHLGWLGSYLANETSTKTNVEISRENYERLVKALSHIGFPSNSYEDFRRVCSVEKPGHWIARSVFANLLWGTLCYHFGGEVGVLMWFSGLFYYTFSVRDFNYRGHGGRWLNALVGGPTNHPYFGFIAGEWHDNHHAHPRLAHSGLAWWQLDVPYLIIKALKWCGIVEHMNVINKPLTLTTRAG